MILFPILETNTETVNRWKSEAADRYLDSKNISTYNKPLNKLSSVQQRCHLDIPNLQWDLTTM